MLFLRFLILFGPIFLLFWSSFTLGSVNTSKVTNKKLTYEIVVEYLKKINLKSCTIIVEGEQDKIPFLFFIDANIYVKVTKDINTVFIDHFGAVQALVMDLEAPTSPKTLETASNEGLFNASFHWILTGTNLDKNTIDKWLNRLNIHVDSKMTVVNLFHNGETKQGHQQVSFYDIWQVYYCFIKDILLFMLLFTRIHTIWCFYVLFSGHTSIEKKVITKYWPIFI